MKTTKILYVEDELSLAKIVQESLESRGFDVRHVADGAKVIRAFHQFLPDICVLDVMLPGKDGFELGKEIKSLSPHLPVLFLTAKTQTEDLLNGFASGGNDYIKKPFSIEELIVRMQNLLSLSGNRNEEKTLEQQVILGKFYYYPKKLELLDGKTTHLLSHRENELMKILAKHQNQIIQRKQILQEIWGDDSFFNSRNLDVYVKKLRTLLQDDPSVRIVTLKGVGYRFIIDSQLTENK